MTKLPCRNDVRYGRVRKRPDLRREIARILLQRLCVSGTLVRNQRPTGTAESSLWSASETAAWIGSVFVLCRDATSSCSDVAPSMNS
jgi:hypothetical protein